MTVTQDELLQLPVEELLRLFGAGQPAPGSGSAAALAGLVSAALVITVCKLTTTKDRYAHLYSHCERTAAEAQIIARHLRRLFQSDSDRFGQVIQERRLRNRNKATSEEVAKEHHQRSLHLLEDATTLVLETADRCVRLLELAIRICAAGYQSAAADSFGAAWFAVAGAQTALAAAKLNLQNLEGNDSVGLRHRLDQVAEELEEAQQQLRHRISTQRRSVTTESADSAPDKGLIEAEVTTRLRFCAKRLRGKARQELRTSAPHLGRRLVGSLSSSEIEAFLLDLETRLEVEQRLVHNRVTVDQVNDLIDKLTERTNG